MSYNSGLVQSNLIFGSNIESRPATANLKTLHLIGAGSVLDFTTPAGKKRLIIHLSLYSHTTYGTMVMSNAGGISTSAAKVLYCSTATTSISSNPDLLLNATEDIRFLNAANDSLLIIYYEWDV